MQLAALTARTAPTKARVACVSSFSAMKSHLEQELGSEAIHNASSLHKLRTQNDSVEVNFNAKKPSNKCMSLLDPIL